MIKNGSSALGLCVLTPVLSQEHSSAEKIQIVIVLLLKKVQTSAQVVVIILERWPLNVHSFLPDGYRRSVACWHFCQDVFLVVVSVKNYRKKENYILSALFLVWEVAFSSSAYLCPLNSQKNYSFTLFKTKWN